MRRLFMVLPLVFLLCFTFSCQKGEEVAEEVGVAPLSDVDVAAIKTVTEAFIQAVNSEDWAAIAAMYTEDAVLMPPNQPIVQGREAIQKWFEAFPTLTEFNLIDVEIDGYGDLAFSRGTISMTIALEGAPEPIKDEGKTLVIFRKQSDGSWLLAIDIFNSDLPLPTPPKQR